MPDLVIYEKPTCTTCRTLSTLLAERGIDAERIDYHVLGLTEEEVREIVRKAGVPPRDLLRTREPVYAELGLAERDDVSDDELIARINATWATPTWTPIVYDPRDDFPRSVAALRRADVLLVNPVRDGLNLVAKEGPLLNQRDGVLVLSTEAGAHDEIGAAGAVAVNPFDVAATADALHRALSMPAGERASRAGSLRAVVERRSPADWLADQLRCVEDGAPRP